MISGVVVKPLKQFPDERGKVMHMVRSTDEVFEKFGEIYFSTCNPNAVKAWKLHKKKTSIYCVVAGDAKIVLHDMREESESRGKTTEIKAGESNYILVKIPPGVAHGFKCISNKSAMIANLASEPYDSADNFDIEAEKINYTW